MTDTLMYEITKELSEKKNQYIEGQLSKLWITLENIKDYKIEIHKKGVHKELFKVFLWEDKIWEFECSIIF